MLQGTTCYKVIHVTRNYMLQGTTLNKVLFITSYYMLQGNPKKYYMLKGTICFKVLHVHGAAIACYLVLYVTK